MGPVADWKKYKFCQCRDCFDTNWAHEHHFYFDGRQRMVGRVCGHRFVQVKRKPKAHISNAIIASQREQYRGEPEMLQALLPEYCRVTTSE